MKWFGTDRHGLATTFLIMGLVYAAFMTVGILLIRLPPPGWEPPVVRVDTSKLPHAAGPDRTANQAIKMPQFWLLWIVLCFNVTAGIGILERAAPIYRDYFPHAASPAALTAAAAGFVAMLSLANSAGRLLWSTASDAAGRKNMYRLYLGLGAVLYVLIVAQNASKPLFLVVCILLLSFYGAGFSTLPAYLRDLFGYLEVGAIHGRLLTAWSTAGVLGPVIVNAVADNRIAAHVVGPERYRWSFAIMVILLLIGLVCNELIRTPKPPSFLAAATDTRKPASVVSSEGGR